MHLQHMIFFLEWGNGVSWENQWEGAKLVGALKIKQMNVQQCHSQKEAVMRFEQWSDMKY